MESLLPIVFTEPIQPGIQFRPALGPRTQAVSIITWQVWRVLISYIASNGR